MKFYNLLNLIEISTVFSYFSIHGIRECWKIVMLVFKGGFSFLNS
jgi:hypothetical protein